MTKDEQNTIDAIIGANLKLIRRRKGMSQEALGKHLDLTFQQIQKYEKGSNRLSGSRMVQCAMALGVNPILFFTGIEGLPKTATVPPLEMHRSLSEDIEKCPPDVVTAMKTIIGRTMEHRS